MLSGLTPETWRVIGYVRDAVVILAIVVGGMYILSHPEKVDAFLNLGIGSPSISRLSTEAFGDADPHERYRQSRKIF
jgi:hypothetical protein